METKITSVDTKQYEDNQDFDDSSKDENSSIFINESKLNDNYGYGENVRDDQFMSMTESQIDSSREDTHPRTYTQNEFEDSFRQALDKEYSSSYILNPFNIRKDMLTDYYRRYHELSDRKDRITRPDSARTKYLEECDQLGIAPEPLILNSPRKPTELNISSYKIGSTYALANSRALNILNVTKINISDNRLGPKGSFEILNNINSKVTEINMSDNNIGHESVSRISSLLNDPLFSLTHLYLKNTNLNDNDIINICKTIAYNESLHFLDLSYNRISGRGAAAISSALSQNRVLKGISLGWNEINSESAKALLTSLTDNNVLEVFDVSWNKIGGVNVKDKISCINELCKMVSTNTSLLHVDFGHNNFNKAELELFAAALTMNHTIIGLHMEGNNCTIDPQGYIVITADNILLDKSREMFWSSRVRTVPLWEATYKESIRDNKMCWICGGWVPYSVRCKTKSTKIKNMKSCISVDNYIPFNMDYDQNTNTFVIDRMLPPGNIDFMFITEDNSTYSKPFINEEIEKECVSKRINLPGLGEISVGIINVLKNSVRYNKLINYPPPRSHVKAEIIIVPVENKIPWTFPKSIFYPYPRDRDSVDGLARCFENDWKYMKCNKFIKDEVELNIVKQILKANYKTIFYIFKFYCGLGAGSPFSIQWNGFTEFVQKCGIPDDDFCQLKDVDTIFIATNLNIGGVKKSNEKALCRFEFQEAIVRVSLARYLKNKTCDSPGASLSKLLTELILPKADFFDLYTWRFSRFYNEPCDIIFKTNKDKLQIVFDKNSGREALPGEKPFISLTEYTELMNNALGNLTTARDIVYSYIRSIPTVYDELTTDEYMKMYWQAYLDAIGQISEGLLLDYDVGDHLSGRLQVTVDLLIKTLEKKPEKGSDEMKATLSKTTADFSKTIQPELSITSPTIDEVRKSSTMAPPRRSSIKNPPRRESMSNADLEKMLMTQSKEAEDDYNKRESLINQKPKEFEVDLADDPDVVNGEAFDGEKKNDDDLFTDEIEGDAFVDDGDFPIDNEEQKDSNSDNKNIDDDAEFNEDGNVNDGNTINNDNNNYGGDELGVDGYDVGIGTGDSANIINTTTNDTNNEVNEQVQQ